MTPKERAAKVAAETDLHSGDSPEIWALMVEDQIAAAIREAEAEAEARGRAEEREACAELAQHWPGCTEAGVWPGEEITAAIRARGQPAAE